MWFQIVFPFFFVIQYCLSVSDPVFIKKTKIEYDDDIKCKDNPFLFLLPENMRHTIKITLSKKPGKKNLNYCKNSGIEKSCCTSFTYSNIKRIIILTTSFNPSLFSFFFFIHQRYSVHSFSLNSFNDLF